MEAKKPQAASAGGQGQQPDLEALQQELEKIQLECARLKDLAGRSQADLQNAKIRLEKEASESRRYAVEGLLLRLLPTVDNLQRAFAHLPEELKNHEWVKGLIAIEQAFMNDMQAVGLTRLDSLGQKVDPSIHEILQSGPGEDGVITEVYEEGYTLHDKVLRPARVKVGNGQGENGTKGTNGTNGTHSTSSGQAKGTNGTKVAS